MPLGTPTKYSDAELKLIRALSPEYYSLIVDKQWNISPVALYRDLCVMCFLTGKTGPATVALCRVTNALEKCEVSRSTPEFDNLCNFEIEVLQELRIALDLWQSKDAPNEVLFNSANCIADYVSENLEVLSTIENPPPRVLNAIDRRTTGKSHPEVYEGELGSAPWLDLVHIADWGLYVIQSPQPKKIIFSQAYYHCEEHGNVVPNTVTNTDPLGISRSHAVCPQCDKPVLLRSLIGQQV